mgnify:CR=1 FL=1
MRIIDKTQTALFVYVLSFEITWRKSVTKCYNLIKFANVAVLAHQSIRNQNKLFRVVFFIIWSDITFRFYWPSDLLTVTNYIRQNLTANFSASHSCTLELPSGILSPYMLKMTSVNTFKCLYLKWKRLNDHWIINNTTANLILYSVMI